MVTTNTLKEKQTVMELGTHGKDAYSNKHVKAKDKQKLGFSG